MGHGRALTGRIGSSSGRSHPLACAQARGCGVEQARSDMDRDRGASLCIRVGYSRAGSKMANLANLANISGAERGAIFASVPTRVSARLPGGCRPDTPSEATIVIPRGVGKSRRRRVGPAQSRASEVAMLIPYDPLEHLRDPDMRCKDLVSTRGAKISIEILKGA
jgi:hypothetical protein